jgi:hypothetical protein
MAVESEIKPLFGRPRPRADRSGHNLLFLGRFAVRYDANLFTPASPWGPLIVHRRHHNGIGADSVAVSIRIYPG